jgi:hypothetical protein
LYLVAGGVSLIQNMHGSVVAASASSVVGAIIIVDSCFESFIIIYYYALSFKTDVSLIFWALLLTTPM